MALNKWACPTCGEVLRSIGPVSLQWEIDRHNLDKHALNPEPKGIVWTCPDCKRVLERADMVALETAIKGHNRIYHEAYNAAPCKDVVPGSEHVDNVDRYLTMSDRAYLRKLLIRW